MYNFVILKKNGIVNLYKNSIQDTQQTKAKTTKYNG